MDNIRNFSIIAHIDHGKSTLADRFLELTGTISKDRIIPQFLDKMDLEREKGITIKMKPVRMSYNFNGQNYILNLIDTPGHVDFSYEVSRSLAAVEGAILLVDATKGIQAQTLANLELAKKQNLIVIPVINKIDLEYAKIEETKKELAALLNIGESEIIQISAKNGVNIEKVLEAIIKKIPPPLKDNILNPFRALIFDSKYDPYKGVITYIRVIDGEVKKGLKIKFLAAKEKAEVKEVGYFNPEFSPQEKISAGEIGYIITGIKDLSMIKVGDTIIEENNFTSLPFPGYREAKPMIFISLYPQRSNDFDLLKEALLKLKLNDPALVFEQETKEALGRGFRCGFLGGLHAEIISERLSREFGLDLIISTPSVVYKIIDKKNKERFIYSASDWPNPSEIQSIEEPWVLLEIITPIVYSAKISEIIKSLRGIFYETKYLGAERIILVYEMPLIEVITNFYDKIKSISKGFASMNYNVIGYRASELEKIEILIAGKKEEAFSKIVPKDKILSEGRYLVKKLKENLPPQQFELVIQAAVRGKIIARETIKARRKDVTDYLYGGDYTRKRKLLEKQKRGKKELKEKGQLRIPVETFFEIFRE